MQNSIETSLTLYQWPIDRLIPYARNARKNDPAIGRMVASIREFGFKIPILARSDGEVVDGHLRLKAARQLGMTEVPVMLCDEWSPAQVRAFRLMVNRSASWAGWDLEVLGLELREIQALDFDLQLTGFDPGEIDRFLAPLTSDEKADRIPDAPVDPVTRRGDLWRCGNHRILCGDAISADDVGRLLANDVPPLMVTDPPYGVEYDPLWREQAGLGQQRQTGRVANDHVVDWTPAYRLFPGDIAYIWHAGIHAAEVAAGISEAGFAIRSQIIWAKHHFVMSRGHYHWQHEPCWYAVRPGKSARWRGDRSQSTLWQVANLNPFGGTQAEDSITGHGTQKPVELMRRAILNHTERGELIYDPFLGSGTTLISAEQTGRIAAGLEIDPRYVDVIVQRWESLTGFSAVLEGDSRSFQEIAAARCGTPAVHASPSGSGEGVDATTV